MGAVAVDVGGVGDRSVVDVALGEGMAGGALAGFAGIEGRSPAGQVTVTEGSVTVTPVRVTLPVFLDVEGVIDAVAGLARVGEPTV